MILCQWIGTENRLVINREPNILHLVSKNKSRKVLRVGTNRVVANHVPGTCCDNKKVARRLVEGSSTAKPSSENMRRFTGNVYRS